MHYGVIDNNGGVVDVTRKDRLPFFVKSTKNGIESFRYVTAIRISEKMIVHTVNTVATTSVLPYIHAYYMKVQVKVKLLMTSNLMYLFFFLVNTKLEMHLL